MNRKRLMTLGFAIAFGAAAAMPGPALGQGDQPSPGLRAQAPPTPSLPPGVGPQALPNEGVLTPPRMPNMPGAPPGVGAQPMPPQINEPVIPAPEHHIPPPPARSTSLISFLDSTAPFVQAFDFMLMIVAGIFCLRARKAPGLTILGIACFVSAVILLGFFLFAIFHGNGAFPQIAYIVARLLAPFELLLFAIAIVLIARQNMVP
jgi:hypothetical protein